VLPAEDGARACDARAGRQGEGIPDLLRKVKRPAAAASGSPIRRALLSAHAAERLPWRSWWAALRLPQPGHGKPRNVLKRQGG
jgi:hypothetical protein